MRGDTGVIVVQRERCQDDVGVIVMTLGSDNCWGVMMLGHWGSVTSG